MRKLLIRLNNWVTRVRKVRVPAANLLLLLPHCLQIGKCERNIKTDVDRCARCGRCDVAGLLRIRDRYGLLCNVASGGRQAFEFVKRPEVRAVVAVACNRELVEGIRAAFPKPVLAVPNMCPAGPCRDTRVDLSQVEECVRCSLDGGSLTAGEEAADPPERAEGK